MPNTESEIYDHAMHMLFTARWNIPQASLHMGRTPSAESWTETKAEFRQYCVETQPVGLMRLHVLNVSDYVAL